MLKVKKFLKLVMVSLCLTTVFTLANKPIKAQASRDATAFIYNDASFRCDTVENKFCNFVVANIYPCTPDNNHSFDSSRQIVSAEVKLYGYRGGTPTYIGGDRSSTSNLRKYSQMTNPAPGQGGTLLASYRGDCTQFDYIEANLVILDNAHHKENAYFYYYPKGYNPLPGPIVIEKEKYIENRKDPFFNDYPTPIHWYSDGGAFRISTRGMKSHSQTPFTQEVANGGDSFCWFAFQDIELFDYPSYCFRYRNSPTDFLGEARLQNGVAVKPGGEINYNKHYWKASFDGGWSSGNVDVSGTSCGSGDAGWTMPGSVKARGSSGPYWGSDLEVTGNWKAYYPPTKNWKMLQYVTSRNAFKSLAGKNLSGSKPNPAWKTFGNHLYTFSDFDVRKESAQRVGIDGSPPKSEEGLNKANIIGNKLHIELPNVFDQYDESGVDIKTVTYLVQEQGNTSKTAKGVMTLAKHSGKRDNYTATVDIDLSSTGISKTSSIVILCEGSDMVGNKGVLWKHILNGKNPPPTPPPTPIPSTGGCSGRIDVTTHTECDVAHENYLQAHGTAHLSPPRGYITSSDINFRLDEDINTETGQSVRSPRSITTGSTSLDYTEKFEDTINTSKPTTFRLKTDDIVAILSWDEMKDPIERFKFSMPWHMNYAWTEYSYSLDSKGRSHRRSWTVRNSSSGNFGPATGEYASGFSHYEFRLDRLSNEQGVTYPTPITERQGELKTTSYDISTLQPGYYEMHLWMIDCAGNKSVESKYKFWLKTPFKNIRGNYAITAIKDLRWIKAPYPSDKEMTILDMTSRSLPSRSGETCPFIYNVSTYDSNENKFNGTFPIGKNYLYNGADIKQGYGVNYTIFRWRLPEADSVTVDYFFYSDTGDELELFKDGVSLNDLDARSVGSSHYTTETKNFSTTDTSLAMKSFIPIPDVIKARYKSGGEYHGYITVYARFTYKKGSVIGNIETIPLYTENTEKSSMDDLVLERQR